MPENTKMIRVLLSIGHGRLHFIEAARSIVDAHTHISLIGGYFPKRTNTLLIRAASALVGRNLSPGLRKRIVCIPGVLLNPCTMAEVIDQCLRLLCRMFRVSTTKVASLGWSIFGWQSCKYIKDADIFHVRSGAGQGGAIKRAKKLGMKVLVDQSALHPMTCIEKTAEDYNRWGCEALIEPNKGVWINVEKDCREADMILVNAEHIKDSFVANGYDVSKIRVAYLGVREDFISLKTEYQEKDVYSIVYTGNFSILKGAEYMLEAVRMLVEEGVDLVFTVFGRVDIPDLLKRKYANLPVVYRGSVPQDELKAALASADAYVFPSLADGCAKSAMEAMAAGVPVVLTRETGAPIVDEVNGLMVPSRNAGAVANAVKRILKDPSLAKRLGTTAAAEMREHYSWSKYGEAVRKVYEEILTR